MQPTEYFPPGFPFLLPTREYHNVRNDDHTLHNDTEGHQKAHGTPHGAKIAVIMAVSLVGEVVALASEGGTAAVEAIGVVYLLAAGLWQKDR